MSEAYPVEITARTPLLLRRIRRLPKVDEAKGDRIEPRASHMTVVTTQGNSPEMHDQQEDRHR